MDGYEKLLQLRFQSNEMPSEQELEACIQLKMPQDYRRQALERRMETK